MTLTLQTIQDHNPSPCFWETLTKAIGSDLTTELSIGDVLISNGLDDALRCLRFLEPRTRVAAILPAVKRASVYTTDQRVHNCIADIEKWLAGDDTVDLMAAARAARAAAWAEQAASWAAGAADAARAAALAEQAALEAAEKAATASWAAGAAGAAGRKLQEADLLAMFPPMILKREQK